jgi:hypothetical protein
MGMYIIRIAAITALLLFCMFLPFMPGSYDAVAVTLSATAQLIAIGSLLLVPLGLAWLFYEIVRQRRPNSKFAQSIKSLHFAILALVIAALVLIISTVGAFANDNRHLGILMLIVSIYIIAMLLLRLKRLHNEHNKIFIHIPIALIIIPVILAVARFTLVPPAIEQSREVAIQNSGQLISDIEAYYARNGHYPLSLLSANKDYKPLVTGIKEYHYEPNGDSYNLFFEQFSYELSAKEFVMYNKLDEHEMTSHNHSLLNVASDGLVHYRGYFAVRDLPQKHWKYFLFD